MATIYLHFHLLNAQPPTYEIQMERSDQKGLKKKNVRSAILKYYLFQTLKKVNPSCVVYYKNICFVFITEVCRDEFGLHCWLDLRHLGLVL